MLTGETRSPSSYAKDHPASYPLSELSNPGTKIFRSGTLSSAPQLAHSLAEGLLSAPHSPHSPRGWVTSFDAPPARLLFSPLHFPQSSHANPQATFDPSSHAAPLRTG